MHITCARSFVGKTDFSVWIGSFLSRVFICGYLTERVNKDDTQTVSELEEAIGNEITNIDSEVTKAVFDRLKKRAQDFFKLGGHFLKSVVIEN